MVTQGRDDQRLEGVPDGGLTSRMSSEPSVEVELSFLGLFVSGLHVDLLSLGYTVAAISAVCRRQMKLYFCRCFRV